MKIPFVNFGLQYKKIKPEIDKTIDDVLSRGDLILRKDVEEFEEKLAKYIGIQYAIGVNSGTDALLFSLLTTNIHQGDEVLVPAHTFFATIEAVIHCRRATPVLVDVGADLLMDLEDAERKITSNTKAIIPVHLAGNMVDMYKVMKLAAKYNLVVIEDACQALGAKQDKKAGSYGLTGCFSFYPAKILGAYGDAGAVVTNDPLTWMKIRLLRNHGGKPNNLFVGHNSRLDNLQAAILNTKFNHLDDWLVRRANIALSYNTNLKGIGDLVLPEMKEGRVWQDYIIRTNARDALFKFLQEKGIETIINRYPFPSEFQMPEYTQYIGKTSLRLPIAPELTDAQIKYVITQIQNFYEKIQG